MIEELRNKSYSMIQNQTPFIVKSCVEYSFSIFHEEEIFSKIQFR